MPLLVISDAEIEAALVGILSRPDAPLPTPGVCSRSCRATRRAISTYLETHLDLLDRIGEQNYGQLRADPPTGMEGEADWGVGLQASGIGKRPDAVTLDTRHLEPGR